MNLITHVHSLRRVEVANKLMFMLLTVIPQISAGAGYVSYAVICSSMYSYLLLLLLVTTGEIYVAERFTCFQGVAPQTVSAT
jgi:hypothetical protein